MSRELDGYTFHNEHGCLGLFSPELWPAREALLPLYDEFDAPYQVLSRRRDPAALAGAQPARTSISVCSIRSAATASRRNISRH